MADNKARKISAVQEKFTKTQILNEISAQTGLTKKDVSAVIDELGVVIERHVKSVQLESSPYQAY